MAAVRLDLVGSVRGIEFSRLACFARAWYPARGSRDRRRGTSALQHMVSASGCRKRVVLGRAAREELSNSLTAVLKRLELLEL